ncbi:MAG: divalent-cation tolerance protein CutA [Sphingomonadales bacterium]|nr:divalent-cation tolerance protein CutA [Sphingomonadales bacterium]
MTEKDLSGPALIWCPCPDGSVAEAISVEMLDERLVACANILGPVRSLFIWQGERGVAEEFGVLFKTDAARLDRAVARLAELHPYDCPAISGWRCDAATPAVLAWLGGELR